MKKTILKICCASLTAVLVLGCLILAGQRNALLAELDRWEGEYDPRSIVLQNTTPEKAERLAARYGAVLRLSPDGSYGRLTLPEGTDIRSLAANWENVFRLGAFSPDHRVVTAWETAAPDYPVTDPDFGKQTYLNYLNLGSLWENNRGRGITVAVIDTGIDTDHPAFAGRISELSYNASEDKTVRDYGWEVIEDSQGHGTASSGVIAAAMDGMGTVGIAPEVELLVIKADCDSSGSFLRVSDLVFGLYYAISQNVRVINMSFGFPGGSEDPFAEAVELAWDSDILCVAAACNRATDAVTWPAANEKVLGVGAIDEDWALAAYSNYGPNVDLVAPGKVFTTMLGGGYGVMEGTSFASPAVAASLVLLLEQEGVWTEAETAWELLVASCRDLGQPGLDETYGFGVPDVSALVLGHRGTVTFDMGREKRTAVFLPGIPVQNIPAYKEIVGWYRDRELTELWEPYREGFTEDLTLYAQWEAGEESPWRYEILPEGTLKILGWAGGETILSVPETLEGRTVSAIGPRAFETGKKLTRIEIPGSVETVDSTAFCGLDSLEYIGVSEENDHFSEKDGVLFNASGKILVAFPAGRGGAYQVPVGVNEIGDHAFAGSSLETVDLNGVKTLGTGAFRGAALKELALPDSVTRVWSDAFRDCAGLTSVKFGSGLKSTPAGMFAGCSALKTVEIPAGIRTLGEETFAFAGLETVTFAEGSQLTRMGEKAFYGCRLRQITVPSSVKEIGNGAFGGCGTLETIELVPGNKNYRVIDGVLLTLDGTGLHTFPGGKAAERYALPGSVTEILPFAFAGTEKLGTLVIPEGFVKLGDHALREGGFETLVLPESLEAIGTYALAESELKELTVPGNVRILGRYAFAGSALETLTFAEGSRVETVPAYLFDGCESLTEVIFGTGSNLGFIQAHGFENASNLALVDFGDAPLTAIGNYAFRDCGALRAPVLPESLKTVGRNVFDGCGNLGLLTLPEGLEHMGSALTLAGDADGNGKLNYLDALNVLRFTIGLGELEPDTEKACDMDGNGKLTYQDALIILRRSIGLA